MTPIIWYLLHKNLDLKENSDPNIHGIKLCDQVFWISEHVTGDSAQDHMGTLSHMGTSPKWLRPFGNSLGSSYLVLNVPRWSRA